MTLQQLRLLSEKALGEAGDEEASSESRALLLWAADLTLPEYTFRMGEEAGGDLCERVRAAVRRRASGEPLQYITGTAPFFGRVFLAEPGVLIPRFDTEVLAEAAVSFLKDGDRVLDLCTGSGCVLLTVLLEGREQGVTGCGSDISDRALALARRNSARFGISAEFVKSDLFERIDGTFDLITANPPYIETEEIGRLEDTVRLYEPREALDGGEDGLDFYRRIASEAPDYLNPGGRLAVEIGYNQGESVPELLRGRKWQEIRVLYDAAGRSRAVTALRP